jgi:hypothetical protein
MERFVVTRAHEDLWWVSHGDKKLSSYSTEEEARVAALALANEAAARGLQSTVVVVPPAVEVEVRDTRPRSVARSTR